MGLILVHRTLEGEPVGVWDEDLADFYAPGKEEFQGRGSAQMEDKGFRVSWAEFAERKATGMSHTDWWTTTTSDLPLKMVLDQERARHFSKENRYGSGL